MGENKNIDFNFVFAANHAMKYVHLSGLQGSALLIHP